MNAITFSCIREQCMQFIRSQKMNFTKYSVKNFYGPKMWMVFLLLWRFIAGTHSTIVTSQLQIEANAILNSGWWNTFDAHFTSPIFVIGMRYIATRPEA